MIGIYQILNKIDGKFYIGSSVNVFKRWWDHKNLLKRNKHRNLHLQRAWNKYGEENFEFVMLEYCNEQNILEKEQFWIDWTKVCEIGYNFAKNSSAAQKGLKRTNEQLKKLSEAHKGIKLKPYVIENLKLINTGAKRSEEARKNMSKAQKQNLSLFKPDKWPHGWRCRCEPCKLLHKKEKQKYPNYKKMKKFEIVQGFQIC